MYPYLASAKLSAFFKSEKQDPVFSLVVNVLPRILPGPHKLISLFIQNAIPGFPLEVPSEKSCNACSASLPFQVFSLLCHNDVGEGGGDVVSFGEARMPMACIRLF